MMLFYLFSFTIVVCSHYVSACIPVRLLGDGRSTPSRDTNAPTITCPSNILQTADPAAENVSVWWDDHSIVVEDNSNDVVIKTRTGPSPGSAFSEGVTTIIYHARDYSGNYASCSFNVTVQVIRCSQWDELVDGWKSCNVGYEMRYGTVCEFGCYTGHVLIGASVRECLISGEWDTVTSPFCQKVQCPALSPTEDQNGVVNISCNNENYYGSKCTYTCIDGYAMLDGYNNIRLCTDNETWQGDTPVCYDTSPPVYIDCPSSVTGYAGQLKESGHVFWDNPTATDNSGLPVPVSQTSGPFSGSELQVGQYVVEYRSSDGMNNIAVCSFTVVVKQISCPKLEDVQYTTWVCPDGRILGARCDFYCEEGTVIIGQSSAECVIENIAVPNADWNFLQQPYCEAIDMCPTLSTPENGNLDCDTWELGKVCHMTCDEGFVIVDDTSTDYDEVAVYETLIVCGQSGLWSNSAELPRCQEEDARAVLYLDTEIVYGNVDDCTELDNETLHDELVQAFKIALQPVCHSPSCNVTEIQALCPDENSLRRKRSATNTLELRIYISSNILSDDLATVRSNIINITKSKQLYDSLVIDVGVENNTPENIQVSQPSVLCESGSGYNTKTTQCVKCNSGYYYDNMTRLCIACPVGYYQDVARQTSCIQCPAHSTTETQAAASQTNCIVGCEAGYYSQTGTPPCSACDMGSYSDTSSNTQCTVCPNSQSTFKQASTTVTQCQNFDILITSDGSESTRLYGTLELQNISTFTLSVWFQCYSCEEIITLSESPDVPLISLRNNDTFTLRLKSGQYDSGLDLSASTAWRKVTIQHTKEDVQVFLDDSEVIHIPIDRSVTENVTSPVSLDVGGEGFQGSVSQLHVWSSLQSPDSYVTGSCVPEVTGDLLQWGEFANPVGSFVITYSNCDASNNCSSSPCQNGGNCTNAIEGFNCVCQAGYTGTICDAEVDDCEGNICQNNGTCLDGAEVYTCACAEGYTGDLCELIVVNGGWTSWDITSSCSVTCGAGVQQRARVCENPAPSNGGTICEGSSDDVIACETDSGCVNECSVNPTSVDYGDMNCEWTDNVTRVCEPTCHEGYDFDNNIYMNPICSAETGFTWNIRNGDNPFAQIPSCTQKSRALSNVMYYSATYLNLPSLDTATKSAITNIVNDKLQQTECVLSGRCTLEQTTVVLTDMSSRRKRNTGSSVMFTSTITCESQSSIDGCYNLLVDVISSMELYIEQMDLTVQYNGIDYDVEVNSSTVDGSSTCSTGYIPVMHYCLLCGKGTYAVDNYCEFCALGYYQDEVGHTSCKQCPDGYTTQGLMTRDRELCNVTVPPSNENINWQVFTVASLGTLVGLILLIAAVYLLWDRKLKKAKSKKIYTGTPEPETPPVVRFNMKNVWYMGKPVKKEANLNSCDEEQSVDNDSTLMFDVVEDINWNNDDFRSIDLPETPISFGLKSPPYRYSSPIPAKHHAWK